MDHSAIGRELRARRTAAGRTVASVAADAGLSVPYIANLENGRGNPTLAALTRLAEALGLRLAVTLVAADDAAIGRPAPATPASLVRLGRTERFRRTVSAVGDPGDPGTADLAVRLVTALAGIAEAAGLEPAEADWWRLVDALLLITRFPAAADAASAADPAAGTGPAAGAGPAAGTDPGAST